MIKNKLQITLIALFVVFFSFGCGAGKHPSDYAAKIVMPGTGVYFTTLDMVQNAHNTLKLDGSNTNVFGCIGPFDPNDRTNPAHTHSKTWAKVSQVKIEADPYLQKAWAAWLSLSQLTGPDPAKEGEYNATILQLWNVVTKLLAFLPDSPQKQNVIKEMSTPVDVSNK